MKQSKPKAQLEKDLISPVANFVKALELMSEGIIMESVDEVTTYLYKIAPDKELEVISLNDVSEYNDTRDWDWSECYQSFNELSKTKFRPYLERDTFTFNKEEFEKYLDTIIGDDFSNKKTLKNRIKRISIVLENYKKQA